MLMPMLAPITSAAIVGAAKESWSTKPSDRPIMISLSVAIRPASDSSAGGGATGDHAQIMMASDAESTTRS